MRDWLSIEIVFSTLLVTSFASVGIVALWVSSSTFPWFLRLAMVAILLSPLLLVPAHEPFIIFAFQAAVIVLSTNLWRSKCWKWTDWKMPKFSISIAEALLATAIVAVAIAIIAGIPKTVWAEWPEYLLVGCTFAVASLIGSWLVSGGMPLRRRIVVTSILMFLVSIPIACLNDWPDLLTESLTLNDFQNWPIVFTPLLPFLTSIWLVIVPATTILVGGLQLLFREKQRATSRRWRQVLSSGLVAAVAIVMLPPSLTVWKLAHPARIPVIEMPTPNGYGDFVSAGELIQKGSPMLNTAVEPKSTQDLADEVSRFAQAYERIRLGLSRKCAVCSFPADGDLQGVLSTDDMGYLRSAARALMREAELARQQSRFSDAAKISVENVQLGQAITREGLMIDFLVGVAIEGIAFSTLYPVIDQLDDESCRAIIDALQQADKSREPFSEIVARDRIWSAHAFGWAGHLTLLLDDIVQPAGSNEEVVKTIVLPRTQAITRLLIVEIALKRFRLQHDRWPDSLQELVPVCLLEVPIDPYDLRGGQIRYSQQDGGYILYSVGVDRDDDGGRPSEAEFAWDEEGDLRLDRFFQTETNSDDADDAATQDAEITTENDGM